MHVIQRLPATALLLLVALVFAPVTAQAGESYDNCTGFIDSVPATISTQGVWCLRNHLGSTLTSGSAITIAANNVTVDCNGFKIGGLQAGDQSTASGIYAYDRQNVSVRRCNVRGFAIGIYMQYGAGYLIEDNRLDNNLAWGIAVDSLFNDGTTNIVRNNLVYDTGGGAGRSVSRGIEAAADITGNTVSGVFAALPPSQTNAITIVGIWAKGSGNVLKGNVVRGLALNESGAAYGLWGTSNGLIEGNHITSEGPINGTGVNASNAICRNNTVANFSTGIVGCTDAGGNISY